MSREVDGCAEDELGDADRDVMGSATVEDGGDTGFQLLWVVCPDEGVIYDFLGEWESFYDDVGATAQFIGRCGESHGRTEVPEAALGKDERGEV